LNSDNDNLKDQLTKAQQRHGQRNITATSIFSIIYFYSVNATVLNLFAVKIGMPPDKVGLMNSFVSLFAIVQLFLANALKEMVNGVMYCRFMVCRHFVPLPSH
jgi:hypothetical protein